MGLHNPERHFSAFGNGTTLCDECGDAICVRSNPCRCCLAAEVEALRAQVQAVRDVSAKDTSRPGGLGVYYRLGWNDALRAVTRALNGGEA